MIILVNIILPLATAVFLSLKKALTVLTFYSMLLRSLLLLFVFLKAGSVVVVVVVVVSLVM